MAREKCSCLGRENEKERKLKAKEPRSFSNAQSAIPQHPSASTGSPRMPHSTAQTLAFPFTFKGLCSQKLPLCAWVAGLLTSGNL